MARRKRVTSFAARKTGRSLASSSSWPPKRKLQRPRHKNRDEFHHVRVGWAMVEPVPGTRKPCAIRRETIVLSVENRYSGRMPERQLRLFEHPRPLLARLGAEFFKSV